MANRITDVGGVLTTAGSFVPDPLTKAILMGSGVAVSGVTKMYNDQQLNDNYFPRSGRRMYMQNGGVVPVVERGEVVKRPNGEAYKVGGGSHESGNDTEINEPEGTLVFSNDLKIGGKSMADYEVSRIRREKRILKKIEGITEKIEDNAHSAIEANGGKLRYEKALAELMEINKERQGHLMIQEAANMADKQQSNSDTEVPEMMYGGKIKKKYGKGTPPGGISYVKMLEILGLSDAGKSIPDFSTNALPTYDDRFLGQRDPVVVDPLPILQGGVTMQSRSVTPSQSTYSYDDKINASPYSAPEQKTTNKSSYEDLYGAADAIGFGVNLLNNPDEPNFFSGYGDEALALNSMVLDSAAVEKARRDTEIGLASQSARNRIRNSGLGVGQYLANMSATDLQAESQRDRSTSAFMSMVNNILSGRGNLANNQESVQAQAEARLFDSKERRWDNITSNLAKVLKNTALVGARKEGVDISTYSTDGSVDKDYIIGLLSNLLKTKP